MEIDKIGKSGEFMETYFPAFLSIFLDIIIVQAPNIPNSKGLDM